MQLQRCTPPLVASSGRLFAATPAQRRRTRPTAAAAAAARAPTAPNALAPRRPTSRRGAVDVQCAKARAAASGRRGASTRKGFAKPDARAMVEPWEAELPACYHVYYKSGFKPPRFTGPIELQKREGGPTWSWLQLLLLLLRCRGDAVVVCAAAAGLLTCMHILICMPHRIPPPPHTHSTSKPNP